MRFQPKTEEDLKRENLCEPGTYPFTVLVASDKQSQDKRRPDGSFKEMIALKLDVHADDGFDYHVYDYISPDFMAYKLRHFAVTTGLQTKYESGNMSAADCEGRQGWCEVVIQEDKTYGPKNAIKDYFPDKAKQQPIRNEPEVKGAPTRAEEETDDVPF